ncbi:MAG: TonB-dependent receptor [Gemmatimonadota bacterium]|nr:TonB-dependent receptor [Gemmatimonadota bacterium]
MCFRLYVSILLSILLLLPNNGVLAAREQSAGSSSSARIFGKITTANNRLPLPKATVHLENTGRGTVSDDEGKYEIISIAQGSYSLVVSRVGYVKYQRQVAVGPGQNLELDFVLEEEVYEMDMMLIEGHSPEDDESKSDRLLNERQQSVEISDAVGSEDMSRAGSGNAADAVKKVTGVSVVDGKYVYIRGLGDRYSSTRLNGSELPSPDPYRKAVQMDMFPSSLLDKIVTIKSFSPDKPGNFSGGAVEMWTKRFPEKFTFSFSQSASFNPQSTSNGRTLLYTGGSKDWLGFDDGTRALPSFLSNPGVEIPDIGSAWSDKGKALELDRFSKAFSPVMAPSQEKFPANQSYSLLLGNQVKLFGRPLGMLGSISYSRKYSFYDNGVAARWQLTGSVDKVDELDKNYFLNDSRGTDEALWGGLINLSYKLSGNHEVGFNYMYNRSGESEARYLYGEFPRDLSGNSVYETRVLKYTERSLNSYQLRGEHDLSSFFGAHVEWNTTYNESLQEEPDLRYFTDNYTIRERNGSIDTTYSIRPSIYPYPNRYYRDLNENNLNFNMSVSVPFKQWNSLHSSFKFGGAYTETDRAFRERRFELRVDDSRFSYKGDTFSFWQPGNMGLVDTTGRLNRFANYVADASEARGNYDGGQRVAAGFAMVELPLTGRLQIIGGLRIETTDIQVASHDESLNQGDISEIDYLPAANFIYMLNDETNVRLSYGRTLARPTFREMAPYSSFDFVNDLILTGNENLKRTLIDNFDLRWEWFVRNGEILAASVFYKNFTNPIERVIKTVNGEVQYQNVGRAQVAGLELEARQRLDWIHPALRQFMVGTNFSLIHSEVDIGSEELHKIRAFDPDTPSKRPMQGQSPYMLNIDLSYINQYRGTTASLIYNVFGERLSAVSLGGTPDIYEQPRGLLDLTFKQRIWGDVSFKFAAKNLLNSAVEKVYTYKGRDFPSRLFRLGRTFTFGVSYSVSRE